MKKFKPVSINAVNDHAFNRKSFCLVGNESQEREVDGCLVKRDGMGGIYFNDEFKCQQASLEAKDIEKLYLLGIPGFDQCTRNTFLVKNVERSLLREDTAGKVMPFIEPSLGKYDEPIDLCNNYEFSLILVSKNHNSQPLIILDGNHRTIAYFLLKKSFEDVPVYICEHPDLNRWKYSPVTVREKL
jgi:hypothetical protein